jgi:isoprenylcysteine carboxyl methyltransferase (ICMT) family protein YpbQ
MLPFHEFFFLKGFPLEVYNVEFQNSSQSCLLSVVISGILKWVALKSLVAINTLSIMISVHEYGLQDI